jgi:hypothetical protein
MRLRTHYLWLKLAAARIIEHPSASHLPLQIRSLEEKPLSLTLVRWSAWQLKIATNKSLKFDKKIFPKHYA